MAYSKQNFQDGQILTAANLEKMENGIIGANNPYNLLDNSDFSNTINQRGQSSYAASGYTVDRWKIGYGTIEVHSSYLSIIATESNACVLKQFVDDLPDGTYTFAAKVNGVIKTRVVTISEGTATTIDSSNASYTVGYLTLERDTYSGKYFVTIRANAGYTVTVAWAALYEGSYTAATLPPYVPRGYAAELAECQRYFERLGGTSSRTLGNAVFAKAGAKSVIISIKYSPKRLSNPTLSLSVPSDYRMLQKDAVNASTFSAISISSFDDITTETPFAYFRVNLANALQSDSWLILQRADGATGAYIDVNADM